MKDIIENWEDAAEKRYYEMMTPDGKLRCSCGNIFDPEKEGGTISPNPWAMPVCEDCLKNYQNERTKHSRIKNRTGL